jgi:hypothetical protein
VHGAPDQLVAPAAEEVEEGLVAAAVDPGEVLVEDRAGHGFQQALLEGEVLGAFRLGPPPFGDIVEHHRELQGGDAEGGDLVPAAERGRELLEMVGDAAEGDCAVALNPLPLGAGQGRAHGAPEQVLAAQPGEPLERGVEVEEAVVVRPPGGVQDQLVQRHPGEVGLEQQAEALVAVAALACGGGLPSVASVRGGEVHG